MKVQIWIDGIMEIMRILFMPPFKEEGVYCFANVGWLVGRSVGRPNGFR